MKEITDPFESNYFHKQIDNTKAVQSGDLIFFGGITPTDENGNLCDLGDVSKQTRIIINRFENCLKSCGYSLRNLVFLTVYLSDIRYYDKMNEAYCECMPAPLPPRKVLASPMSIDGMLVEMSGIVSILNNKSIPI